MLMVIHPLDLLLPSIFDCQMLRTKQCVSTDVATPPLHVDHRLCSEDGK